MRLPWHRNDPHDLGRELRAGRPEPRADFESALERDILEELLRERPSRHRVPGFRLGFAASVTVFVLVGFAAAGGMAAASSSVRHAFADVAQVVHISSPAHQARADQGTSPASDQYGRKKSCVKTAAARKAAALRAALGMYKRDRALAGKEHRRSVAKANKRYAEARASTPKQAVARRAAALRTALRKYKRELALAGKHHRQRVANANKRYKADVKKCPIA